MILLLLYATWYIVFFFLMIRRPPRSTLDRSSAASDVYKRQAQGRFKAAQVVRQARADLQVTVIDRTQLDAQVAAVSYTHLRAHETVLDLVCRLLLEKKKQKTTEFHL